MQQIFCTLMQIFIRLYSLPYLYGENLSERMIKELNKLKSINQLSSI